MANENEQQGDWQEDEAAQWTSTEGRHMISKGRNVGYWKNGRSLEGTLVPMPVFMRSALMQGRREALGLTLEDVAEKVGVNKSTIQRYESGKIKRIPNDVLDKLEELYGASLREAWVDNTKQPERTEQTTPVSIVQEYPATLEQQLRENRDTVQHFHYDITVQHDVLERNPDLMHSVEELVMILGDLDPIQRNLVYRLTNQFSMQNQYHQHVTESSRFYGAKLMYEKARDMVDEQQREELEQYLNSEKFT